MIDQHYFFSAGVHCVDFDGAVVDSCCLTDQLPVLDCPRKLEPAQFVGEDFLAMYVLTRYHAFHRNVL